MFYWPASCFSFNQYSDNKFEKKSPKDGYNSIFIVLLVCILFSISVQNNAKRTRLKKMKNTKFDPKDDYNRKYISFYWCRLVIKPWSVFYFLRHNCQLVFTFIQYDISFKEHRIYKIWLYLSEKYPNFFICQAIKAKIYPFFLRKCRYSL